jgi:putative DNA primase/helicase
VTRPTVDEVVRAFCEAMAADGVEPGDQATIEPDAPSMRRFHVKGDRPRTRNGWYRLHSDGRPAGAYGHWRSGVSATWRWDGPAGDADDESRAEAARRREESKREAERFLAARRAKAVETTRRLLRDSRPADPAHSYLRRKQVAALEGLRETPSGTLVVPVYGADGEIRGAQKIYATGRKLFVLGTRVSGGYFPAGTPDETGTVLICEGYATGATLREATGDAVAVAFDCNNLPAVARELRKKLGRTVRLVVVADDDRRTEGNPGLSRATTAAEAAMYDAGGALLAVPEFGDDDPAEATDVNDLYVARGGGADGSAAVKAVVAAARQPAVDTGYGGYRDPERPTIRVAGGGLVREVDQAISAVGARPDLRIFVRDRRLVRVTRDGSAPRGWSDEWPGSPSIEPLDVASTLDSLGRAARWERFDRRSRSAVEINPPTGHAAQVLSRPHWEVPYLDGVVETPVVRRDGSVVSEPGYDEETRVWYWVVPGSPDVPRVARYQSPEDARRAALRLLEPVAEFPFVADSDRAAYVAGILSIVMRSAIDGPVPMFGVSAPTPGTGKSLLLDVMAATATGEPAPRSALPRSDEELEKKVTAILVRGGARIAVFDNADRTVGSDELSRLITSTVYESRELGKTKSLTLPNSTVWAVTGNNLTFRKTMARRVVPIGLDSGLEHPERRSGFAVEDLLSHVRRDSGRLLAEALVVVRGFFTAGAPRLREVAPDAEPVGGFEAWDDRVRAAVIWAGLADPATTERGKGRGRIDEASDEDVRVAADALEGLAARWPSGARFTASDVVGWLSSARADDDSAAAVRELVSTSRRPDPSPSRASAAFRALKDRPVTGLTLRYDDAVRPRAWWIDKAHGELEGPQPKLGPDKGIF